MSEMFTGIIEEKGVVAELKQLHESMKMEIDAKVILEDIHLGESISVNGVCLTVTSFTNQHFTVDIMPETFRNTSLRLLKVGSSLNLERSMVAGGRFGGHFVSGHVDGIGKIQSKKSIDNAVYYDITVPNEIQRCIINKGSIAVDGISLTIFDIGKNRFTISLIPHTLNKTILGEKNVGDIVNIECDMLGKYVDQFIQQQESHSITKKILNDHGFA